MGGSTKGWALVACDVMRSYLEKAQQAAGTAIPTFFLDRSLHVEPKRMQAAVLDQIQALDPSFDTILIGMGFCGGAWDQVVAPRKLVIPRVDDCVSLILQGAGKPYEPNMKEPWHLYVHEGDESSLDVEKMMENLSRDPEYKDLPADLLRSMFFGNYRNVDIVDTGLGGCYEEGYVAAAQEVADQLGASLDFVMGSTELLEALVTGMWDHRFVVAEPGQLLRHGSFFF